MTNQKPLKSAEILIHGLSAKGNGLGKTIPSEKKSTKQIEVPFTLPNERVQAILAKGKKGKGQLLEVIEKSPERILPRCKHFGACGGCRLQHLKYEDQLKYKEQMIKDIFKDLLTDSVNIRSIVPSPSIWNYRNKMEYTFSMNAAEDRFLGLIMEGGKNRVLNLTECHLVNPWFTQCLEAVRQWWQETGLLAFHPYKNTGTLRTLILRESIRTGDRLVMLTVSGNPDYAPKKSQLNALVSAIRNAIELHQRQSKLSIFLRIQQAVPGMATNFYEMLLFGPDVIREEMLVQTQAQQPPHQFHFHISPTSFFQPNPLQAENLYRCAIEMAQIEPEDTVYDLYCGTGTIGICASQQAKEVVGIEVSPESALDARTNIKLNQVTNSKIYVGAIHHVLDQVQKDRGGKSPDVVIIDPPRAGLETAGQTLIAQLNAKRILYVSCNPTTQVKDIQALSNAGYHLMSIQPVDMFPQTMHVENIALLVRTDS